MKDDLWIAHARIKLGLTYKLDFNSTKGLNKVKKITLAIILILVSSFMIGCASYDFEKTSGYIVTPKEALGLSGQGAIFVDVQSNEDYGLTHIEGAVNIPMGLLTVDEPYKNMLPNKSQVEDVMSQAGILENDTILVYDNAENMQAARVQWTLNMYSNFNVMVISGGIAALEKAGANMASDKTVLGSSAYTAGDKQKSLVVSIDYLKSILNMPEENTVIIDTRSSEEYAEGTIPGALCIEYVWNNYGNGEYKNPRDIQSTYIKKDILPDMKIILFCKTSVRATQTYTALKDAGYKDVRIYDGAWLEYSDVENPVASPENVIPTEQDAS